MHIGDTILRRFASCIACVVYVSGTPRNSISSIRTICMKLCSLVFCIRYYKNVNPDQCIAIALLSTKERRNKHRRRIIRRAHPKREISYFKSEFTTGGANSNTDNKKEGRGLIALGNRRFYSPHKLLNPTR